MSPTRRDILKASAGAVTTAPAGVTTLPSVKASTPESSIDRPMGIIRKGHAYGVMAGQDRSQNTKGWINMHFDGDLDGGWTLLTTPSWRMGALIGDRDGEYIYDCRKLTGDQVMEIMWRDAFMPPPAVLSVEPFGKGFYELVQEPRWRFLGTEWYSKSGIPDDDWHTLEQVNERCWETVVWNHPLIDAYPGYNAIIYCRGFFYLAVIDHEPMNCTCCAP